MILDYSKNIPSTGTPYTLKCVNKSSRIWTFYVYQKLPNQEKTNTFSLAWLVSPYKVAPGDQITFIWYIQYCFVWGSCGSLKPGVTFSAGGVKLAKLQSANSTTFNLKENTPILSCPAVGQDPGSLSILNGADLPDKVFTVGIGMSGVGTFVQEAGPNLNHLFTPTPTYWVAAGAEIQVGTILDIKTVTQAAQIEFENNQFDIVAELGSNYTWNIIQDD